MSNLYQQIRDIPDGGLWKSSSETTFLRAASELSELGMDGDQIVRLLTDLYHAVAHCYGE